MNFATGLELIDKLGLMGPPLLLTSVAALALTAERAVFLFRERSRSALLERRLEAHLNPGNWESALSSIETVPGPLAALSREFIQSRQLPLEVRQRDCETFFGAWMTRARGRIKTLVTLAQIAPLLGLTGTVLGLVGTFRVIGESSRNVNPALLAGGIWEALLTTVAGMVISIPLLVIVRILQSQLEGTASKARTLYASLERRLHMGNVTETAATADAPQSTSATEARFRVLS